MIIIIIKPCSGGGLEVLYVSRATLTVTGDGISQVVELSKDSLFVFLRRK